MSEFKSSARVFSREFKVGVVRRMLAGESVSALARELKFSRKDLYIWRDRLLAGGPEALRGRGRPRKAAAGRRESIRKPASRSTTIQRRTFRSTQACRTRR